MAVGTPCGSGAPLIWGETRVTATAGKSGQSLLIRAKGLRISPGPLLELLEQGSGFYFDFGSVRGHLFSSVLNFA